jgi:hypothetical protein
MAKTFGAHQKKHLFTEAEEMFNHFETLLFLLVSLPNDINQLKRKMRMSNSWLAYRHNLNEKTLANFQKTGKGNISNIKKIIRSYLIELEELLEARK